MRLRNRESVKTRNELMNEQDFELFINNWPPESAAQLRAMPYPHDWDFIESSMAEWWVTLSPETDAMLGRVFPSVREVLADVSHDIWSSWMRWMFTVGTLNADGTWTMPVEKVERWQRQMNTSYADLTEREKDSDREQADKIMAILDLR